MNTIVKPSLIFSSSQGISQRTNLSSSSSMLLPSVDTVHFAGKQKTRLRRVRVWAYLALAGAGMTGMASGLPYQIHATNQVSMAQGQVDVLTGQLDESNAKYKTALSTWNLKATDGNNLQDGINTDQAALTKLQKTLSTQQGDLTQVKQRVAALKQQVNQLSAGTPFQLNAVAKDPKRQQQLEQFLPDFQQIIVEALQGRPDLLEALIAYPQGHPFRITLYDAPYFPTQEDDGSIFNAAGDTTCKDSDTRPNIRLAGENLLDLGPILDSEPAIYKELNLKYDEKVLIHELLGHTLDCLDPVKGNVEATDTDGLLPGFTDKQKADFIANRDALLEKIKAKQSQIWDYALTNNHEALAVFVETFFSNPELLKTDSPESAKIYQILADYFNIQSITPDPSDLIFQTITFKSKKFPNAVFDAKIVAGQCQQAQTSETAAAQKVQQTDASIKKAQGQLTTAQQKLKQLQDGYPKEKTALDEAAGAVKISQDSLNRAKKKLVDAQHSLDAAKAQAETRAFIFGSTLVVLGGGGFLCIGLRRRSEKRREEAA